jgi:molecular chaperone GrpE (heat shock protein)
MLSIKQELQKIIPVDLDVSSSSRADGHPADLVTHWRQVAAGIAEISATQRRFAEQLQGLFQPRKEKQEPVAEETGSEDRVRATSTAMMAFLESLDDLSAMSVGEDPKTRKIFARTMARAHFVIEAAGLTEIAAEGAELNEDVHEVVGRVPADSGMPAGRVVRVVQRGFRSGDHVLRRAQVVVAAE